VRLGLTADQGISFRVPASTNPLIFAPMPLYNTLQARTNVPYYNYKSGTGIDFGTPSGTKDLAGVDVDGWMRALLAAVDTMFSPEFLIPAALVDRLATAKHTSWIQQLTDAKQSLATSLSHLVAAFFTDEQPTYDQIVAAQDAFGQQALIALSNVYAVNAVVQFAATVDATIDDPGAQERPRLYGTFMAAADSDPGAKLTAAKIPLASTGAGSTPLTFLVTATGKDAQGAVESVITLDLTYRGSQIEHQIGNLPQIEGYEASSWLSFAAPPTPATTDWPLDVHLGPFEVPLPLRVFPTPPSMVSQQALTHPLDKPVDWQKVVRALQWDYAFAYNESFHYPHDQIHFTTTFNVIDSRLRGMVVPADPVPDIFEFMTAYPQVQVDLVGKLVAITEASSQSDVDTAGVAVDAFVKLINRVSVSLAAFLPAPVKQLRQRPMPAVRLGGPRGPAPYDYTIVESAVERTNPGGDSVSALYVDIGPLPAADIGTPKVTIDGYDSVAVPPPPDPPTGYCFTGQAAPPNAGDYLPAVKGQAIPRRTVVLPDLDILAAQSAITSAYIQRNQDLIRPRKTVERFVYQTATVAFPTPLRPTIDVADQIAVASFGGDDPVARTFAGQLDNLLTVLFAKAPAGPQTIQVAISYTIALNGALTTVGVLPMPVLFLPPTAFQPKTAAALLHAGADTVLSQDQLIAELRAGVYAWANTYGPPAGGDLLFSLTVMSSLNGDGQPPMPLLILEDLALEYQYWSDHPPLASALAPAAE
jgi:hypothetical protein